MNKIKSFNKICVLILIYFIYFNLIKAEDEGKNSLIKYPKEFKYNIFSDSNMTPSPACLCVDSNGDVYVGVDKNGSLKKDSNNGQIIKLIDSDNDGKADIKKIFATVDGIRGLLAFGDKVWVLYTDLNQEGVSTGMNLGVFTDSNRDGIADGEVEVLVRRISTAYGINSRGVDHATNGIQMGIDGWIYIAIGDFGFYNAEDKSGNSLTLLGGGIVRVRPNGTQMEIYTTGMRNIYDIAIDPYMNIFTRGNTNDGGGWNIRFTHHIQSGEYGYPRLYVNFSNEIIPALADLGGGSGVGGLYIESHNWPKKYNKNFYMADWGRKKIFNHKIIKDKSSFRQKDIVFGYVNEPTDLDIDTSGNLYVSVWNGAGFKGNPKIGYIEKVSPKGLTENKKIDFNKLSINDLANLLKLENDKIRIFAQQELILRKDKSKIKTILKKLIEDKSLLLASRVAALYSYSQIEVNSANILEFINDNDLAEFVIRASTDDLDRLKINSLSIDPFVRILKNGTDRQRVASIVALGRIGNREAAKYLLEIGYAKKTSTPSNHKPNSSIIIPHLAVKSLVKLNAVDDCLKKLGSSNEDLALWALSYMHSDKAVQGLISYLNTLKNVDNEIKIIEVLARLYFKEAPYKGDWWWKTKPDNRGPYYKPILWNQSKTIESILLKTKESKIHKKKLFFSFLNKKYRLNMIVEKDNKDVKEIKKINDKIVSIPLPSGEVSKAGIEDVTLALSNFKVDSKKGKRFYEKQQCNICHALKSEEKFKGPFMGQIGSIMTPEQIAKAILRPNETISQGFPTVNIVLKSGEMFMGFIVDNKDSEITIRDMAGSIKTIKVLDIKSQKVIQSVSMMPPGLVGDMSMKDFVSLVKFLSNQK